MLLVNLYRFCRKRFAEKTFHKNSILGDRANIQHTARCVNHGEKRQIVIGEHCEIKGGIFCYSGGKIQIGNHFYCGGFTYIHAAESITIGDCVILSNHIRIMDNNSHPVIRKSGGICRSQGWNRQTDQYPHYGILCCLSMRQ